uniref:NTR domain-containing protein n=1 Tax=Strigamia maritima TaxID=126957 RepID=T1IX39_STRMM
MERPRTSIAIYLLVIYSFVGVKALNYVVSAPNVFRLNVPETVGISLSNHPLNQPVTVEVLIKSYPHKTNIMARRLVVESGKPQITTLTFPESAISEIQKTDEVLFVYLVVTAPLGIFPEKEIILPVRKYSGYAFLQTDKPLYTPKDIVKIRILNLNEKLIPNDKPVLLEIKNPNASRVLYEKFNPDDKGIIEYVFKFPIFPVHGLWSASIKYGYQLTGIKTVHFEVKEYELPTFSVKIEPPKVILKNQKLIETRITANYVYGKPVVGLLNIKFGIKTVEGIVVEIGSLYLQPLKEGERWISINVERDIKQKNIVWFPEVDGSNLLIEAEVIEKATGNRETAIDYSTIFSYSPFVVSFPRSSLDFKPGVPYQVQADVKFVNGKEAPKVSVSIISAVSKKGGQVFRHLPRPLASLTNELGRVMFELGTGIEDQELEITVTTEEEGLSVENQATNVLNVIKFKSPDTTSYVWIAAPPEEMIFTVGRTFQTQVTVFPAAGDIKLHYMVVSRGMLLLQGESASERNAVVHPIQFSVTADMSPSARVIVYIIKNNQIIADSMKIDVHQTCKYNNGDDLKLSATATGFYKPGQNVKIEITGERDSFVGLLAVDEAVYLLNKEGLLTRKTMFDEMERHDLGCGPGGGQDTEAVFRKTGFLILSNAAINEHKRIDGECDANHKRNKRSLSTLPKPVKVEHFYTGLAAVCCKLGRLTGPDGMDCTQRAAVIYAAINDTENCSQAFLDCCETEVTYKASYMAVARSAMSNKANDANLEDSELIDEFEVYVLQNLRHLFPETWIFHTEKITNKECSKNNKNSCKLTYSTNFPHSITTWRVQALAVSQTNGSLCIAEPIRLTVFKSVFIQMQLPYSAVRMEQILVPVTIFNYGDEELPVTVYMYGVEGICMGAGAGERSESQKITIPKNSATTVTFPIMPLEVASYPLRVVALSWSESDAVEKILRVVPEGIPVQKPLSIMLDPSGTIRQRKKRNAIDGIEETFDEEHNRQSLVIDMPLPKEYIPGTEKCLVSTMGDFLGQAVVTSIQGLEARFFHLPTGCGEQTMIKLAPLVYSVLYLKRTGRLTAEGEKNGYSLMQQGYSFMLNYRKADGSFAVYQHVASSTWLTALVAKVLCQASLFIDIPKEVTCNALDWTLRKQRDTGAFFADFGVYHTEMIGGVQSEATLTAYVLISIMECSKCDSADKRIAALRAISYLEHHVGFLNHPYSLAVVTYALTLAKSPKASSANAKLKALAIFNEAGDTRFWDVNHAEFQGNKPWIYVNRPNALAVETTSYALLTQLLFDDIAYSHPIINWLNQQRNDQGAFASTQDTIMALQAMAEYSYRAKLPALNMVCNVSSQTSRRQRSLIMTNENSLVLQKLELPAGGKIHVDVEGKGIATMSLSLHYNIESSKKDQCKFDLKIQTTEIEDIIMPQMPKPEFDGFDLLPEMVVRTITSSEDQKRKFGYKVVVQKEQEDDEYEYEYDNENDLAHESRHIVKLEICVRHLGDKPAGMSILDIGIFTGYKPVKDDLVKLLKDATISQYEPSDTSVVLYIDTVPHDEDLCIKLRTMQEISVGKVQPTTVKIYDYYEPDKSCQKFYTPDGKSSMLSPICEGRQCRCVEGQCPPCFPFSDLKKEKNSQEQRNKLMRLVCDKHNFVWNGTLIMKSQSDGFVYYDFLVTEILKEGLQTKEEVIDEIITFTASSACACPAMEVNKVYIIMGRDGFRYKDEHSNWKYKYTFDQKTSVHEMHLLRNIENEKEREMQKTFLWLYRRMIERGLGCDQ